MSEVELNEDELFDSAVTDEPEIAPEPQLQIEQLAEAKAELEAERAAKLEPEAAELTAEKPPIPPKPEWRLKEDAERARNAETELANERAEKAALKQRLDALERASKPAPAPVEKAAKPDPLLDPEGYAKAIREEIREEHLNERRNESLETAREADPKAFDEAYQASLQAMASGDVTIKARMQSSRNPGKTLLEWHKEQRARAEVGTDLNAYKAKLREEALKDPEFRKAAMEAWRADAQPTNGRPRVDLPPSMNGMSRSSTLRAAMTDDVSDDALFEATTG